MKIICIGKNICSHGKKNLFFLPSNMAAVQNLYCERGSSIAPGKDLEISEALPFEVFACKRKINPDLRLDGLTVKSSIRLS